MFQQQLDRAMFRMESAYEKSVAIETNVTSRNGKCMLWQAMPAIAYFFFSSLFLCLDIYQITIKS